MTLEQLAKQGRRTASMTTAATISSKMNMIRKDCIKQAFYDCENIKYRYEFVDTVDGVSYYDDSAACSNEAIWFSFDNLHQQLVWITYANNPCCDDLLPQVRKYVKSIICIGCDTERVHSVFGDVVGNKIYDCDTIEEAVRMSHSISENGDAVMFSPATNPKDGFVSYSERGDYYKQCVKSLK